MLRYPFDERFIHYGYEDVLCGKSLKDNHISILHVDNPLGYEHFIGNMSFIRKTEEESLHTLYQFRTELQGYSRNHQLCGQAEALPSLSALPASLSAKAESSNKSKAHRQ